MAAYEHANGANGVNGHDNTFPPTRYSKVPSTISVAVAEADGPIDVEISLDDDIQDDPTELCTLLESENSARSTWVTVAIAYAKYKKLDVAIDVLIAASSVFEGSRVSDDKLSIQNALCWLYLLKCREAPRIAPVVKSQDSDKDNAIKDKDYYIKAAVAVLNEASRIRPSYAPLFLARGVVCLMRAAIIPFDPTLSPAQIHTNRIESLKQAAKAFDDAIKMSVGKNLMAKMGKARVSYSLGNYAEALKMYQNVLESSPSLIDPDPRIGIGCCFWQMGFKEDAASAWERAYSLNRHSKIALILLGIYNFHLTAQLPPSDPGFLSLSKKAMTLYTGPSFQIDNKYPLTCATLGSFYIMRKALDKVEVLARRAIDLTDVAAISSDGWYQLARKEHQNGHYNSAADCYAKSDKARGGDERGFVPAKFGSAQMRVLMQDYTGAKFRLEKIIQQQPAIEAQVLLGTLYAEDVFAPQAGRSKEERATDLKKALKHLEDVSKAWKDPKKQVPVDQSVLLNLARLYESEHPDKSLKCLEEVEQLEIDAIPQEDYPEDVADEASIKVALREMLPPQLLNNMGCFHYQSDRFPQARALFQTALNACVKAEARDATIDTDAIVTSISYNLARTYEAEGMLDEAKQVYDGLLQRHAEYIDAKIRLTYIALRQSPSDEGPKAIQRLHEANKENLEVQALYSWYVGKSKKRTPHIADDQEQRQYKYTLQKYDKHDCYSLTGLGNVHLSIAREMRRDTEHDKEKRRKMYERAVEFFEKVLQLDPKNAYAAQGIAIALVEDKKDHSAALQILSKVKETLKDYSVYMNLGHTYCEVKQYARAIEHYEAALAKDRARDPQILACLGRVWLLKGKAERSLSAMNMALEYSKRALEVSPEQVHFQFNVAFVQIQIAQLIYQLPDAQRTLREVQDAAAGLDAAIDSFSVIAKSPNPPFPKHDIEQRANMGRNTMKKQLERALASQSKYEDENREKLENAKAIQKAEEARKKQESQAAAAAQIERRRQIEEARRRNEERDRAYMEKRADDERRRLEEQEYAEARKTDRGAGRKKGGKRKKKGEMDDSETEGIDSENDDRPRKSRRSASGTEGLTDDDRPPKQKKRKLEKKSKNLGKYKSEEMIVDSDSEGEADLPADEPDAPTPPSDVDSDNGAAAPRPRKTARVISEDEDEDEDGALAKTRTVVDDDEDE